VALLSVRRRARLFLAVAAAMFFAWGTMAAVAHAHVSGPPNECAFCQAALALAADAPPAVQATIALSPEPLVLWIAAPRPQPGLPFVTATRGPPFA
jgi:hypothetical protein